jgi:DNA integrity scanning protein DisA with diadenylate cyclase activity
MQQADYKQAQQRVALEQIADLQDKELKQDMAITLALGYLRVCHLANHMGCMVKVDQAIGVLERTV